MQVYENTTFWLTAQQITWHLLHRGAEKPTIDSYSMRTTRCGTGQLSREGVSPLQEFQEWKAATPVTRTQRSDWDFPVDRALAGAPPGRKQVAVNLRDLRGIGTREIGFAVLFIFSRMLGQNELRARLLRKTADAMHIAANISAEATLGQAFASCKIVAITATAEIGLVILEQGAQDKGSRLELSISDGAPGLGLSLAFDPSELASLSAQDFLEKIGIILDALSTAPQTLCVNVELVSPTARALVPDLSKPIDDQRPEFVPETFRRIAGQHPSAPAVSDGAQTYTYDHLSRLVCHLAWRLTEAGIQPGDIVALSGFSSLGMVASMLAVMASGGVFVTLDLALPEERQRLIETISQPRWRIEILPVGGPTTGNSIVTTDWPTLDEINGLPNDKVPVATLGHNAAAYVFFTSGSTGVPKGVLGTHAGLAHFLSWERNDFPIGRGDRVAQLTALSFDPVLRDIFLPLTSGACLQVPNRDLLFDARRMLRWFAESGITLAHCVPSLMKAWLQADIGDKPFRTLRYLLFAGEPLTDSLLKRFAEAAGPDTCIVNLYGPTETTLAKIANRIERIEPGVQPVGYPQPSADATIIRNRSVRCGLWEIGEIAIRTPYRSKGYLRNPQLTAEVFRPNSERNDPEDLVYFTGDLGRVRPDGKIEIFGRTDAQIKIRGVRIEPNEIEDRMLELPGVKDAAVTVRALANEDKVLFGLIVPQTRPFEVEESTFRQSVREALKGQLSDAMVPARIVLCDALPYLPNGKLDRKAIAALELDTRAETSSSLRDAPHLEERMRRLVAGIEDALDRRVDSLDKSFLDLGGDSLSYIRASLVIEDLLGWLPPAWETRPLCEFPQLWADRATVRARQTWVGIEVTLLFRAVSIILMVMSHTAGFEFLTPTSTLFVISGMNFSRFVRPAIRTAGNLRPTANLILKFAIPAGLWQAKSMHSLWLPNLFLLGTFFQNPSRPVYTLWYLDVLAANLILLAGISWLGHYRRAGRAGAAFSADTFRTDLIWVMIGLAMAAIQVLSGWWDGEVGTDSVAPFKWFWMLALGVLITQANSLPRKWAVSGLLAMLTAAAYSGISSLTTVLRPVDAFFIVALGLMLWIERIPVPWLLHRPLVVVASSTLFIYITNYTVIAHIMPTLHLPAWWPLEVTLAVAFGIVAQVVWNRFTGMVWHLSERFTGGQPAAAQPYSTEANHP
jgi:amino acid adenylation domain-containing protein